MMMMGIGVRRFVKWCSFLRFCIGMEILMSLIVLMIIFWTTAASDSFCKSTFFFERRRIMCFLL